MADPVSWLLVEPGWAVYGPGGDEVGKVDEVLGDGQSGIFHGLVVGTVAGDDTCLVVARSAADARKLARELR